MFGYVKACTPELKIKEFETYKAVYCSLCKKLGKSYGILSRFTLSYDFTFLAILNMFSGYTFRRYGTFIPAIWTFILLIFMGVFKIKRRRTI